MGSTHFVLWIVLYLGPSKSFHALSGEAKGVLNEDEVSQGLAQLETV